MNEAINTKTTAQLIHIIKKKDGIFRSVETIM